MEDEPHGQSYYNKAFSHTNNQGKRGDFSTIVKIGEGNGTPLHCQNYKCSPAVA